MNSDEVLTTKQVAEQMGVAYTTVMLWLAQEKFAGAYQAETPRGPVWYIPRAAVEGFEPPTRGRPRKSAKKAPTAKAKAKLVKKGAQKGR